MDEKLYYDAPHIHFLESIWGEGFMSPGGIQEVEILLDGIILSDCMVLDFGCGSAGITISLVDKFHAKKTIGVDVEDDVINIATENVRNANLADKVQIVKISKEYLPFEENFFDVVFSKDSIVHIPNKKAIFSKLAKVLKPGGVFVFSDWLISHDHEPSAEMKKYLALEDLGFGMASPLTYVEALKSVGFGSIDLKNRNSWYKKEARRELDILTGPERNTYEAKTSKKFISDQINTWKAMIKVLDTGEHCPHHFRAIKTSGVDSG